MSLDYRNLKSKMPFKRIKPSGYLSHEEFSSSDYAEMPMDNMLFGMVTQSDFMREYYPSGHKINDPAVYPDIYREEEVPELDANGDETGNVRRNVYKEAVPRYSFAFQQVICAKQLVHLCGNDVQFELNDDPDEQNMKDFVMFKKGWLKKNMEIAVYELAKSQKSTGDGAIVTYLDNGTFGWKKLSYADGDILYPHYDDKTGKLNLLARCYYDYDDEGNKMTEWLEVYDSKNITRLKRNLSGKKSIKDFVVGLFSVSGYVIVDQKPHNFPTIPVVYKRGEVAWENSQDSIDKYEESFSQMAHNNRAYGEPILVLQGENVSIGNGVDGTIKYLTMSNEDKASFLESQSASESYMKQLDTLFKMIYQQSFIVEPPELKSGDLPAAALKILYSPAVEKATLDCKEYQGALDDLVELFRFGYGLECENTIGFANLSMKWWMEPYVHVNTTTVVNDLAMAVNAGFCSKQTASEKLESIYTVNGEWDRIVREHKEAQEADLLYQIKTADNYAAEE